MSCPYDKCIVQELDIEPRPPTPGGFPGPGQDYYFAITRRGLAELDAQGSIIADSLWHNPASTPDLLREAENVLSQQHADLFNMGQGGTGRSTHSYGCADACDCIKRSNKVTLPYGKEVELPLQELRCWPPQRNSDPIIDPNALTTLVERRVTLSDGKTYLITFEVKFYGILRRFPGDCRPRRG